MVPDRPRRVRLAKRRPTTREYRGQWFAVPNGPGSDVGPFSTQTEAQEWLDGVRTPDTSLPALVAWHRKRATQNRKLARSWKRLDLGRQKLLDDARVHEATAAALDRLIQLEDRDMSEGARRIAAERQRQIEQEGFDAQRDEEYIDGELAGAGAAYADIAFRQVAEGLPHLSRPPAQSYRWHHSTWQPSEDPVRNLEKAGALIAAEIDRLLRERGNA